MPPFYPYPPPHTTITTATTTTPRNAAQPSPIPTPTPITDYSAGTSLSAVSIIGIIAAVLFLFSGLAWFAYNALVTKPKQEKEAIRRRRREKGVRRVWRYTEGREGRR
jgi:hypothetical protein